MKTIKTKVWKQVLKTEDWEKRFNLLLDEDNYEENEKYKSKIQQNEKERTQRK